MGSLLDDRLKTARKRLEEHLRGKPQLVELALSAFLGGGHLLLEGPPGTGKTSLSKALATTFGGSFRRVQMTSDLLPSDIVGILRPRPDATEFEFRPGPVFANFVLADELNRTSPKTQSALLEAMAENTVTVDGRSHPLPEPFFVVATQNPLEFQGVYPLAESQTDRFMLQLEVGAPERNDELAIYSAPVTAQAGSEPGAVLSLDEARELRGMARRVHVEATVLEYVTDFVRETRKRPGIVHGVSVRGGLQWLAAARALALLRGRDFVVPADLRELAVPALAHRLCADPAQSDPSLKRQAIRELLEQVPAPR